MTDRKPPAGSPVAPARPAPHRPAARGQQGPKQGGQQGGRSNGTARPTPPRPVAEETPTEQIPAVADEKPAAAAGEKAPAGEKVRAEEKAPARRPQVETAGSITRDSDSADRTASIPVIREPLREDAPKAEPAVKAEPETDPEAEKSPRRGWLRGRSKRSEDDEDDSTTADEVTTTTAASTSAAVRTARLRLVRLDPWSVMKVAFALSFALAIVTVVAVTIVWAVLDLAGVWDAINSSVATILSDNADAFDVTDYVGFGRIIGFAIVIAAVDVILITAIATVGAFLYNLAASLLGGLEVTLAENS